MQQPRPSNSKQDICKNVQITQKNMQTNKHTKHTSETILSGTQKAPTRLKTQANACVTVHNSIPTTRNSSPKLVKLHN